MKWNGLPLAPRDDRRTAGARRRRRRRKDRDYLSWIHTQPCLVPGCLALPSAHHERNIGVSDYEAVPLCLAHHQGPRGRHGLRSLSLFEAEYGVDVAAEIARLLEEYHVATGNHAD